MIEAYCGRRSYAAGDIVELHVSTDAGSFDLDLIRDDGTAARVLSRTELPGERHPLPPDVVARGCGWPARVRIPVDPDWPSGFYRFELRAGDGSTGDAFFVLRSATPRASILWVIETNTWNAYNSFGGASTYTTLTEQPPNDNGVVPNHGGVPIVSFERPLPRGFLRLPDDAPRAPTVGAPSRDIPFIGWALEQGYDFYSGGASWAQWGLSFARWLHRQGIAVDCATNADLEEFPGLLDGYRLMLSTGHDEYWSWGMRDAVEGFIARGGNVAFLSGNLAFWQVRLEDGFRRMVAYKGDVAHDPVIGTADERRNTGIWSHPLTDRPENQMSGLSFTRGGYARMGGATPASAGGYTIYRPEHWALAGTGLSYGDQLGAAHSLVGYEVDGCDFQFRHGRPVPTGRDDTPEQFEIIGMAPAAIWSHETAPPGMYPPTALSDIEMICDQLEGNHAPETIARHAYGHGMMGSYVAPGGGTVFAAGTTEWTMALDDPQVSRITHNLIDRLG